MSQSQSVKGIVDIVFLIDVTGSMQPCIDALKDNISVFIDGLTKNANECPVKHWRAKAVGFRDYTCDSNPLDDSVFVESAIDLRSQLSRLNASGGGDEPESLLDALYLMANQEQMEKGQTHLDPARWRYRSDAARVVIAFTDASYHPKMSVSVARGGTVDDVITAIHANRILLSLFAPEMECHDKLAEADRSEFHVVPSGDLGSFTSNRENFRKTLEMLAKSVSQSAAAPLE